MQRLTILSSPTHIWSWIPSSILCAIGNAENSWRCRGNNHKGIRCQVLPPSINSANLKPSFAKKANFLYLILFNCLTQVVYFKHGKRHPNHEMSLKTLTIYRVTPLPPFVISSMIFEADLGNVTKSSFCDITLFQINFSYWEHFSW